MRAGAAKYQLIIMVIGNWGVNGTRSLNFGLWPGVNVIPNASVLARAAISPIS